jgi:uncharacterized protein (TIGR00661 family)
MATIFYSMCGEGRGHAARVQTVVEMLQPSHRFVLLAARDAYDALYDRYEGHPCVSVRRLPGLFFAYNKNKVDYVRSLIASGPYLWKLNGFVDYVAQMIRREQPDLAITDFEPILPRAAKKCNVPCISMDHQHFLSSSNFESLPWRFRWRGWFLRCSIPLFYPKQANEAVSSFYHLPSRKGTESIARFGVLLRSTILEAKKTTHETHDHLVVYIRRHAPDNFWETLKRSGRKAIVYGLGARPDLADGRIRFREISDQQFVADLANCTGLITTAGNQLVGEAFFLKKPVLAIPEPGNFEQQLNGWLVGKSGGGWSIDFPQFTLHLLHQFLLAIPLMRAQLENLHVCGNMKARQFIEMHLPQRNLDHLEPQIPGELDLSAIAKLATITEV